MSTASQELLKIFKNKPRQTKNSQPSLSSEGMAPKGRQKRAHEIKTKKKRCIKKKKEERKKERWLSEDCRSGPQKKSAVKKKKFAFSQFFFLFAFSDSFFSFFPPSETFFSFPLFAERSFLGEQKCTSWLVTWGGSVVLSSKENIRM